MRLDILFSRSMVFSYLNITSQYVFLCEKQIKANTILKFYR